MKNRLLVKIVSVVGILSLIVYFLLVTGIRDKNDDDMTVGNEREQIITVAAANTGAPYFYKSASGKQMGYNVDVLDLLSIKLGIQFLLLDIEIDEAMEKFKNHEIDLILGLQYNPEFADVVKYSMPFIENKSQIFVKATTVNINSFEELDGKKVVIYKNDPSFSYISSLDGIRLYKTESIEDAATMLRYGTVDAWVGNYRESIILLQNSMYSGAIKMVGAGVETFPSAIAAHKVEVELIRLINSGIDSIKNSDELLMIENKWFGEIIDKSNSKLKKYLDLTFLVVLALVIIVLIIIRINQVLKKEVDKRTREIEIQKKLIEGMLQSLSDGVITIDSDNKILFINDKVLEFTDTNSISDFVGKIISNTTIGKIIETHDIEKCINENEKIIGVEKRIKQNDYDTIIYEYNITPIVLSLDSDKTMPGATIAIRDNTERVILKERMMSIDKLQSIGRMTAGVAHELRNPLTSIDMYIKVLPIKYDNSEFREMMIKDLSNEIKRINVIVDNLLDISKVKKPTIEPFNLSKEITGIVRLVKMQTRNYNIDFIQQIDNRLMIEFDKNQFTQVCVNILSNAIEKLKEENGGKVKIIGKFNKNCVILIFEDSGKMISQDVIESIFEPFYTTKEDGNGLGLSIVYELVSKNNGSIYAYNSTENKPVFRLQLKGELNYD